MQEVNMSKHDIEEQEKRFSKTWKGTLAFSILLLVLSVACMGFGGGILLLLRDPESMHSGIALIGLGMIHISLSIWGISFSLKRQWDACSDRILIYNSGPSHKVVLVCLWMVGACALVVFLLSVLVCIADTVPGIIFGIMSAAFFFLMYYLFSNRRNTRIVLQGTTIEKINAFGRKRVYDKTEIKRVLRNVPIFVGGIGSANCGWEVYDWNDKELFTVSETMVNFSAVEPFFEGKIQDVQELVEMKEAEEEKTEPVRREISGASFQQKHSKQIQIAAWVLFAVDLLIGAAVFLIYGNTNWIKSKYYFLIVEFLPLTFFFFAWIFKDVVIWSVGDARYLWVHKKERIPKWYVNIDTMVMILMVCNLLLGIMPLIYQLQCIKGGLSMFILWLIFFLTLLLVSFGCVGRKRIKLYGQWIIILIFAATSAWGVTDTTFLLTRKPPDHYTAEVVKTGESHSSRGGTNYYVVVLLKDGREQRIMVTKSLYSAAEQGEPLVVCQREGIWNTEFVTLHLP